MTQYLRNDGNVADGIIVKSGKAAMPVRVRSTRLRIVPGAEVVEPNIPAVEERPRGIMTILRIPK